MSIVLKVSPEELIAVAGEIDGYLKTIENQFQGIENDIKQSKSYWEGSASDLHVQKFEGMKDKIKESIDNLKHHPKNIQQEAGIYKQVEASVTQAAQALPVDVIV